MPKWAQPPYSFIWMLLLVSLAIAVAAYPVARTLTRRLEKLRDGVRKFGEGDLSARVLVKGRDEVGYLAEQFNASAQRVQQLIEAQKSLLANASHELRSPLARIRMGMEIMNTGSATPETVDRTRVEIERSIKELDQLIEEILLASKLDALGSGKGVDIGSVELVEMAGLCAEECARVGAELELAVGVVGISVQGHRRLLVRLVRNLLENATRYSQGAIVLRLRKLEPRCDIEIQICDQGQGVPREHRERIFEPFYRLPGASEREGGIGLGLALVKSIALQHQGTVVCEDRPDGAPGACFTVTLPHV
jgi:signal transduction histidine kinase